MNDQIKKGGYVRIIKDGHDGAKNNPFHVGEIWRVESWFSINCITASRDGVITKIATDATGLYPKECEWIGMSVDEKPKQLPIFN